MSAILPKAANPHGLHVRYIVTKADGDPVDPMATYFVLRLDHFGNDGLHIAASRVAAKAYADYIFQANDRHGTHLDRMAGELRLLVENLENAE